MKFSKQHIKMMRAFFVNEWGSDARGKAKWSLAMWFIPGRKNHKCAMDLVRMGLLEKRERLFPRTFRLSKNGRLLMGLKEKP